MLVINLTYKLVNVQDFSAVLYTVISDGVATAEVGDRLRCVTCAVSE